MMRLVTSAIAIARFVIVPISHEVSVGQSNALTAGLLAEYWKGMTWAANRHNPETMVIESKEEEP